MRQSNIYEAGAADIAALFADYLESGADGSCVVFALSSVPLGAAARDALEKSFVALGFGPDSCTYATLWPVDREAEGNDIALDAQALFLLVEGLDPLCVACTDADSARALEQAYRTSFPLDDAVRVFGRPGVAFRDLSRLLQTDDGKQTAWRLLKTLKKSGKSS